MKQIRNRYFLVSDLILLTVAAYLSYILRLEKLLLGDEYRGGFILFTSLTLLITPMVFTRAGLYARYWRYASIEEVLLLIGAMTTSVVIVGALSQIGVQLVPGDTLIPRSIPFIFLLLALVVTASPRLLTRFLIRYQGRTSRARPSSISIVIMGAGDAGAMIVRELQNNPQLGMDAIGFLDDDVAKRNMRIHGVRVLGTRQHMETVLHAYHVGCVIIAMPTAPGKTIREIVQLCEQLEVQSRIIPGIYELIDGKVSLNQLRKIEIEDLLRREAIRTDTAAVNALLGDKRIIITGGGGSIGSELCRQIMRAKPKQLIILGHGENSVFEIENELLRFVGSRKEMPQITSVIADVRFGERIQAIFKEYQPQIVFHAAAHKHVPLMERNPAEAITNNVLGTRNVLEAAMKVNVERFVMISSDKAVNPTSIMGTSKRAAELLVLQVAKQTGKPYVAVRFGNVLGSRGSIVPTFKQQISAGGPITVTHPDVTRYFMTIPEAVQLVLQAAVLGNGGEIFTLDMGEPIKIVDLAHDLIKLSGLEVGRDIDIVFTGLRPGEKLYEELFIPGEEYRRTHHEKIFITGNASNFVPDFLNESVEGLSEAARRNDRAAIIRGLQTLVPEFHPVGQETERSADTVLPSPSPALTPTVNRETGYI